jgi:hypothetical protein
MIAFFRAIRLMPAIPRLPLLLALALACVGPALASAADSDLRTEAERSRFLRTGRYEEVQRLCAAFQARWPEAVRCEQFGTTPQGRPMLALVVSRSGVLDGAAARDRALPVLLVQGGIHAGEIDGKDAGFLLVRELLEGKLGKGLLEKQVLLFVPVFNVDGHERFGAWNRPNQRGPEQMGWRVTAQNYNLNRDYLKADAPEMQAMLGLVQAWDPLAAIDLHVTDGAKFQHDVAVQVEPVHAGDAALREAGRAFRDAVIAELRKRGSDPLPFYPSFVKDDDPASGFADGVSPPRFSTGYFLLRNRFGMLVETHSWKDYPTRVRVTHDTVLSVLRQVAAHGGEWRQLEQAADQRASALAGQDVALDYKATAEPTIIDFRGYAYTRSPSDVSGATMTRYDETKPQLWRIPLFADVRPSVSVTAPRAGYLVPAELAGVVKPRLQAHGVEFRTLAAPLSAKLQAWRADSVQVEDKSTEGHQRLKLAGAWREESRALAAGALYVPVAQPKARLVVALLEPQAPDSLAHWGEFNNFFERKEYMEAYVAEEVARKMLAGDPKLAGEFARRLREDPKFAQDPGARLDFFYRRHAAFDERWNLYPVLRTDTAPAD